MKESRLSSKVIPKEYDIFLDINFNSSNFKGKETISLKIEEKTSKIFLHSLDLEIEKVKLTFGNKEQTPRISFDKPNELLLLEFKEEIPETRADLIIEFSGKIEESLEGLYKSKYLDKNKNEKY